jgi:hypothetical protein
MARALICQQLRDGSPLAVMRTMFERCAHCYEDISRPAGNCSGLHRHKCTKCGYEFEDDTSD